MEKKQHEIEEIMGKQEYEKIKEIKTEDKKMSNSNNENYFFTESQSLILTNEEIKNITEISVILERTGGSYTPLVEEKNLIINFNDKNEKYDKIILKFKDLKEAKEFKNQIDDVILKLKSFDNIKNGGDEDDK